MNLYIIGEYIKKIKKNDIYNYLSKQNIHISKKELDVLYTHLKQDYKQLLKNKNPKPILNILKNELSNTTYLKIESLYKKYETMLKGL